MSNDEALDSRTAFFDRKRTRMEEDGDYQGSDPQKRIRSSLPVTGLEDVSPSDEVVPSPSSEKHPLSLGSAPSMNWNLGTKIKIRTTLGGSRSENPTGFHTKRESEVTSPAQVKASSIVTQIDSVDRAGLDGNVSDRTSDARSMYSEDELGKSVENNTGQSVELDQPGCKDDLPPEPLKDANQDGADSDGGVILHDEKDPNGSESGEVPDSDDDNSSEDCAQDGATQDKGSRRDSNIDESSSNGEQTDAMMDYSNTNFAPGVAKSINESTKLQQPPRLADLSPEDLELQFRYFYVTQNPLSVDLDDPVRCLVCAEAGHTSSTCGALTCSTCGLYGQHLTSSCPKKQRCQKCQERGHSKVDCPYKLSRVARNEIECDLCQLTGHQEIDCELLWRTSGRPWEADLSSYNIHFSCYECGQTGHLGNDCTTRNPRKVIGSSTWSIPHNSKARGHWGSQAYQSKDNRNIKGRAASNRHQQPIQISDSEDDNTSFFRPRIPPPSRSGQIQIRNSNPKISPGSFRPSNTTKAVSDTFAPRGPRAPDHYHRDEHLRRRSHSPPAPYAAPSNPIPSNPYHRSNNGPSNNHRALPPVPVPGTGSTTSFKPPNKKRGRKGQGGVASKNTNVQADVNIGNRKADVGSGGGGGEYRALPTIAQKAWKKRQTLKS